MQNNYRVIFEGKFRQGASLDEVRQKLLKVYKGNHEIVDRFLAGRRLIIRKNVDYGTALKYRTAVEKAGLICSVAAERETVPDTRTKKPDFRQKQPPRQAPAGDSTVSAPADQGAGPRIKEERKHQVGTGPKAPEKERLQKNVRTSSQTGSSSLRGSRLQNGLAGVMILLLAISAVARLWALNETRDIHPPDNVAINGDNVCIHFNRTLYFVNTDGRLIRQVDLRDLGITREPADVALLGNGDLLLGDLDKGVILRCENSYRSCRRIGPAGGYEIDELFKFHADEDRGLLFIADTNNNRLLVQDMEGSVITEIETNSRIGYPNDMAADNEGRLWMSNTLYSEAVSFTHTGSLELEPGKTIHINSSKKEDKTEPLEEPEDLAAVLERAREVRQRLRDNLLPTRPLALAWDSAGNLWMVTSDGFVNKSVLRLFGPEGEEVGIISLGENSLPLDVASAGENVIVADSGLFQIYSVKPGPDEITVFGDENFQNEMSGVRAKLSRYKSIKSLAGKSIWVLGAGTVLLVLIIILKNSRGHRFGGPTTQMPGQPGSVMRDGDPQPLKETEHSGLARKYRIEFRGAAGEYFRIWIVNTFLTIVTLGIYAAWAKVRTRRYFYRNTILNGDSFDYTADPVAILKGYLIVATGVSVYYLTGAFSPSYSLIVFGIFLLIIPLLIYKSLRFFARNSTYRNIRYRFSGTLGDSYRTYLFYPVLIPFTSHWG